MIGKISVVGASLAVATQADFFHWWKPDPKPDPEPEEPDTPEEPVDPSDPTDPVNPEEPDTDDEPFIEPEEPEVDPFIHAEEPMVDWHKAVDELSENPVLEAQAGLVTTLTTHFFHDYNERIMAQFTEKMSSLEPVEYCSEQAMGDLWTTHLCIGQQIITNYNVDEANSHLYIDSESSQLKLRISGLSLDFAFDFRVWSDPEWIHDEGTGTVIVEDSDLSLDLHLLNDNGALNIEYSDAKIHTRDYSVELLGQSDISRAVENMLTSFKSFFQEELTMMLAGNFIDVTQEAIEKRVFDDDKSDDFWTRLICDPLMDTHSISFVLDGKFKEDYFDSSQFLDYPSMPVQLTPENGEGPRKVQSQQFVSQTTFTMALRNLLDGKRIALANNVSSKFLTRYFTNFEEIFGTHDSIELRVTVGEAPQISIREGGSSLLINLDLKVMNPFSEDYEVATLSFSIRTDLEFVLEPEAYSIAALLSNPEAELTNLEVLFFSNSRLEQLDPETVMPLTELIVTTINAKVKSGEMAVKLSKPVVNDLSEHRIFVYDSFVLVQASRVIEQAEQE